MFPAIRMRRYRSSRNLRDLFAETYVNPEKLIMPVFIKEGLASAEQINGMPGIFRYPPEGVTDYAEKLESIGLTTLILFGIPARKDKTGSSAYEEEGVIQRSIRKIKEKTSLNVIADLCLCEYTDHGHCGILKGQTIDNDATLEIYRKTALSYAEAGVDMVAPSGMMDGQVRAIRSELDDNGFSSTLIMAYSSKFASNLYGPFRNAAESAPSFGDRRSYQMDYRNGREAIREIELDIEEGADAVMVKPALFYLDLISRARKITNLPLAAYMVSGEYSMIMNAIARGDLNADTINEALVAPFRAGADMLITYFAESYAKNNQSR
ncbi:MAG: porphobilinogen synthase [Thermoplasmataceae archaeon]